MSEGFEPFISVHKKVVQQGNRLMLVHKKGVEQGIDKGSQSELWLCAAQSATSRLLNNLRVSISKILVWKKSLSIALENFDIKKS